MPTESKLREKEKKSMKKHLFAVVAALMLVAMILSACASTPATTAPPPSAVPVQTTAVPAQPTVAPQATATSAATVTKVTEWDYQNAEPEKTQWQKVLDECTASTGIAIDRQAAPRDELISKVLLAAQQHQLPNVLRIDNPDLQQVADTGALEPLTDYGVDLTGLYANLIDAGTYKGKVYGVDPGINGMALFYNTDMFTAAGLKPPTTWAEVKDDAAKLTKNGGYGIPFPAPPPENGSP